MNESRRPLITYALFAYNLEPFIREAVNSAFLQTYTPLEIILSDDCSKDKTFSIMCELEASYKGPHKIILNCNYKNLGIGGHINHLMNLASGELIIAAAGDDISAPNRAASVYEAYIKSEKKARSIFSRYISINEKGEILALQDANRFEEGSFRIENIVHKDFILYGCSHAWHKDVFRLLGQLRLPLTCEDMVIPFRSLLLGEIYFIDEPLVFHRKHARNTWDYQAFENTKRSVLFEQFWIKERKNILCNWQEDLQKTLGFSPQKTKEIIRLQRVVELRRLEIEDYIGLLNAKWIAKTGILWRLIRRGISLKKLRHIIGYFFLPRVYQLYLNVKFHLGIRRIN